MAKRDRPKRPARMPAYQTPKPTVLVVTEGEATEYDYLLGFKEAQHNPRITLEVCEGVGVPLTIVRKARDMKDAAYNQSQKESDDNIAYDQVWCAFDVDSHPNIPEATILANDNGIKLAISNPCIELWLWVHFAEQPGARHRHELKHMMKQHIPAYDKHVNYADYAPGYVNAVRRATAMDKLAESISDPGMNPTTGMWRLTESIRKA